MSVCVSVKLYYSKFYFFQLTIQDNKQWSYLDQISQYMMKSGLALCACTLQHIKKTFTIALQGDARLTMLLFQIPVNIKYTSQNSLWPMSTRSIDSFWLHFCHQFLMRSLLNFCFRQLYKQMKWKTFPVEQGRNTE